VEAIVRRTVTSLSIDHFDIPVSTRKVRCLDAASERVGDVLAGRTVWCTTALPHARRSAEGLRARIAGAGPGVAAACMSLPAEERLQGLAERLDRMLAGVPAGEPGLGAAEIDLFAECVATSDQPVADHVESDDVVVLHDALSAVVAQAVRDRGAHAVWRVSATTVSTPPARRAREFLARFTPGVDAYVLTWVERGAGGEAVERVAAAMPSPGVLAAKEFSIRFGGGEPRRLAWRMALAEVARSDRGEHVGGTLRPRPTVAAR
jgi:hypothetical protein